MWGTSGGVDQSRCSKLGSQWVPLPELADTFSTGIKAAPLRSAPLARPAEPAAPVFAPLTVSALARGLLEAGGRHDQEQRACLRRADLWNAQDRIQSSGKPADRVCGRGSLLGIPSDSHRDATSRPRRGAQGEERALCPSPRPGRDKPACPTECPEAQSTPCGGRPRGKGSSRGLTHFTVAGAGASADQQSSPNQSPKKRRLGM